MKLSKASITSISIIVCLVAVSVIVYPLISNYYAEKNKSLVLTEYAETVKAIDDKDLTAILTAAREYNAALVPSTAIIESAFSAGALQAAAENYDSLLNVCDSSMMGYIEIPQINVHLPIYHGTDSETLENGIGHLLGSSLPVGGESTHAVLTGHSGMATEKMFTDLDQLKTGDIFYIHSLNDTLAYEVDQIKTVLPDNTDYLGIEKDADYCTLITCTPYAVNTHRLLVRGHRVEYEESAELTAPSEQNAEAASSTWMQEYVKGIMISLVLVALAGLAAAILPTVGKRERHEKR